MAVPQNRLEVDYSPKCREKQSGKSRTRWLASWSQNPTPPSSNVTAEEAEPG
jgi:hypothetical protein